MMLWGKFGASPYLIKYSYIFLIEAGKNEK
jgi:hypothetical protein